MDLVEEAQGYISSHRPTIERPTEIVSNVNKEFQRRDRTMEASREARRRRILERGSDRLALITGRIQTLPSSSSSPYPSSLPSDPDPQHPLPSGSSGTYFSSYSFSWNE